jgi:pimeloyl-ACP methyl ester carboxylesterase
MAARQGRALRIAALRRAYGPSSADRAPEFWNFFLQTTGSLPIHTVARRALILHHLDLRSMLPVIKQPVLMLCGDWDPLVNQACEEALLTGLPNVGRAELVGCRHMHHYSHPEAVVQLVSDFLTPPQ